MKSWPDKTQRERFEIEGFISAYSKLPHGRKFIIKEASDRPDYLVEDIKTSEIFGVELTSEYLNDRSVPDDHKKPHYGPVDVPYDPEEIKIYKKRLLNKIRDKEKKAKAYSQKYPLILSIYVNEYCSIHMNKQEDWKSLVDDNEAFFDSIISFKEVVFWSLSGDIVFSVCPETK